MKRVFDQVGFDAMLSEYETLFSTFRQYMAAYFEQAQQVPEYKDNNGRYAYKPHIGLRLDLGTTVSHRPIKRCASNYTNCQTRSSICESRQQLRLRGFPDDSDPETGKAIPEEPARQRSIAPVCGKPLWRLLGPP
jgi:hypothetical protein